MERNGEVDVYGSMKMRTSKRPPAKSGHTRVYSLVVRVGVDDRRARAMPMGPQLEIKMIMIIRPTKVPC